MTGSRGKYSGDEADAFSRRSRYVLTWRADEAKRIKSGFAKRSRIAARVSLARSADAAEA